MSELFVKTNLSIERVGVEFFLFWLFQPFSSRRRFNDVELTVKRAALSIVFDVTVIILGGKQNSSIYKRRRSNGLLTDSVLYISVDYKYSFECHQQRSHLASPVAIYCGEDLAWQSRMSISAGERMVENHQATSFDLCNSVRALFCSSFPTVRSLLVEYPMLETSCGQANKMLQQVCYIKKYKSIEHSHEQWNWETFETYILQQCSVDELENISAHAPTL